MRQSLHDEFEASALRQGYARQIMLRLSMKAAVLTAATGRSRLTGFEVPAKIRKRLGACGSLVLLYGCARGACI